MYPLPSTAINQSYGKCNADVKMSSITLSTRRALLATDRKLNSPQPDMTSFTEHGPTCIMDSTQTERKIITPNITQTSKTCYMSQGPTCIMDSTWYTDRKKNWYTKHYTDVEDMLHVTWADMQNKMDSTRVHRQKKLVIPNTTQTSKTHHRL